MKIFKKALVTIGILFVLAIIVALLAMRANRGAFKPPTELQPGVGEVILKIARAHVLAAKIGSKVVLFDTALDSKGTGLDALLAKLGARRADVQDIFLTHGHFDHTQGAIGFPQARIYVGAADVDLAAAKVWPEALAAKVMTIIMQPESVKVTDPLKGTVDIPVGKGKFVRAIPMPGHTQGSYAFLYDGILVVGDTMDFENGIFGPPFTPFDAHPAENLKAVVSLKAHLAGLDINTVCPGHSGCTPAGTGKKLLEEFIARIGG